MSLNRVSIIGVPDSVGRVSFCSDLDWPLSKRSGPCSYSLILNPLCPDPSLGLPEFQKEYWVYSPKLIDGGVNSNAALTMLTQKTKQNKSRCKAQTYYLKSSSVISDASQRPTGRVQWRPPTHRPAPGGWVGRHPQVKCEGCEAEASDDSWDRKQETEKGKSPHSTSRTSGVTPHMERAFWKKQLFLGERLRSRWESYIRSVKSLNYGRGIIYAPGTLSLISKK